MKKSSLAASVIILLLCNISNAQNICNQQFSTITIKSTTNGITSADAEGIVADIINVTGLKGNFEIRAADISNAAAVVQGGKRYVLYNPHFIAELNNATGNDWASVSVLAHEIGHHLNGHTLSSEAEPAKELEADEFSGYIMQRLGATLQEAETAMKLAADIKSSATHPGRFDRIAAIEKGWNHANEQLAADIEASETDTIALNKSDTVLSHVKSTPLLSKEDILADVFFDEDSAGQYYLLVDGSLVGLKNSRLLRLGILKETGNNEYPYIIENTNNRLYINTAGIIFEKGKAIGRIRKIS